MKVRNRFKRERIEYLREKNQEQVNSISRWSRQHPVSLGTTPQKERDRRKDTLTKKIIHEILEHPKALDYYRKQLNKQIQRFAKSKDENVKKQTMYGLVTPKQLLHIHHPQSMLFLKEGKSLRQNKKASFSIWDDIGNRGQGTRTPELKHRAASLEIPRSGSQEKNNAYPSNISEIKREENRFKLDRKKFTKFVGST